MEDDSDDPTLIADETEDILANVTDALSRFKPVLLTAIAKDAESYQQTMEQDDAEAKDTKDDEFLLAGEFSLIGQIGIILGKTSFYGGDSIALASLIECLMNNQIVSALAVATWALGALGGHDDDSSPVGTITTHWWKFVSLSIRNSITFALSKLEASTNDLGGGIGMIIDDTAANNSKEEQNAKSRRRLKEALKVTVPIVKYVMERAYRAMEAAYNAGQNVEIHGRYKLRL